MESSSVNLNFDRELCVEEVHPGSDRTSRLVSWIQIPRYKSDFESEDLSDAFTNTDLKPLNNNLQHIKHRFRGVIVCKVF